jgi:hypothetical protein
MTTHHPILDVAKAVIRKTIDGHVLTADGAVILESVIVSHAADPGLCSAVGTLLGLAAILSEEQTGAARMLILVLGRVRERVPALGPISLEGGELRERAEAVFGVGRGGHEKLAGRPPEGAIAVRTLDMPPMPRPGLRLERASRVNSRAERAASRRRAKSGGPALPVRDPKNRRGAASPSRRS